MSFPEVGLLRDQIAPGTPIRAQGDHGSVRITGYTPLSKRHGHCEMLSGQEQEQASQYRGDVDLRVTLHRFPGLEQDTRFIITRHDTNETITCYVKWIDEDQYSGGRTICYCTTRR